MRIATNSGCNAPSQSKTTATTKIYLYATMMSNSSSSTLMPSINHGNHGNKDNKENSHSIQALQGRIAQLEAHNYQLEMRNNQLEQQDVARKIAELEKSMVQPPAKKAKVVEAPAKEEQQPVGDSGGVPSWLLPSVDTPSLDGLDALDMKASAQQSTQQRTQRKPRKPRKQGKCTKCNLVTSPPHNSRTCKWDASTSSSSSSSSASALVHDFGFGFDHRLGLGLGVDLTIPPFTTIPARV